MTNNKQNPKAMTKIELGKAYEKVVGYDITNESPEMNESEIVQIMKEYDEAAGDDSFKKLGCFE